MNLICLKRFDNLIEAYIFKNRLENEGVLVHIFDEYLNSIHPLLGHSIGGIRLMIEENDVIFATKILKEIDSTLCTDTYGAELRCPVCQSTDFYKNFKSFRDFKSILSLLIGLATSTYPLYFKFVNKCKSCGFEFD